MKKKVLSIIMSFILLLSYSVPTNAEGKVYKKYKNFRYIEFVDGTLFIKYYKGKNTKTTVPEKIKGIKVRRIELIRAKGLKQIKIPRYVKEVFLARNKSLLKVSVSKKNKYLSVKNNMVLNKKKTKLMSVLGGYDEIKIPQCVKIIENGSFCRSKVKKVILGRNVRKIGSGAFEDCKKLKEIVVRGEVIPKITEISLGDVYDMNFYVKNKELAEKLLKELEGKDDKYIHIYVGNELVCEKKTEWIF